MDERGRYRYQVTARTTAPVAVVWPLVGEAARWKQWTFMTRTFLERDGEPVPDAVGALRRFAVGPFGSSEEVVAWEPPHHVGYVAVKGMPARHYRADIVLADDGGGTLVTWTGELEPLVPGTGPVVLAYARGFVRGFARRLVRYADRLAGEHAAGA
ncbi:MAG: SRPBCC family protein [Acidimicrobiales bacterium]